MSQPHTHPLTHIHTPTYRYTATLYHHVFIHVTNIIDNFLYHSLFYLFFLRTYSFGHRQEEAAGERRDISEKSMLVPSF